MNGNEGQLTGAQKRVLKSRAQLLEPVIRVGQQGFSDALVRGMEEALTVHELVKVRFSDFKEEKKALSAQLAEATQSALIQVVGNVAIFYRPRPAEA